MNEVVHRQTERVDSSALQDRHALLNPQQGLVGGELRQQERRPARIAWMHREQFRKGRARRGRQCKPLLLDVFDGSWTVRRQAPLPCHRRGGFDRTASAAGDQGKTCSHTTHNVIVLLLFFFLRLGRKSQWCDSVVLSAMGGSLSVSLRNRSISCTIRPSAGRHSTAPTWYVSISTARSIS